MKSTAKRLLLGLVMMVCLIVLMVICVGAEDVRYSEGLAFKSNGDGTCYVSGVGSCTDKDIVIPPVSPEGDKVTKIKEEAFQGKTKLTSVIMPDGVKIIESYAFAYCSSLTNIIIPESVKSIGNRAFYECTAVEEIQFNAAVMNDLLSNNRVFYNVGKNGDGIKVIIGAGVTKIPAYLFEPYGSSNVPKIVSVEFEEGSVCKSIGRSAFSHCESLINIAIPNSVTGIGISAFSWCYSLTSIVIPNSVTNIGSYAFYSCNNFTDVYYTGTQTQWNKIDDGDYNSPLWNATIHFLGDGTRIVICPTCTEQGYTEYTCNDKKCTESHRLDYVPALGHDKIYHKAKDATCTEVGWYEYETCSRCEYTTYREIPTTGHTEAVTPAIAPTCTDTGLTEGKHCSVCGEILEEQQTVPANGHDYEFTYIPPTCTEEGLTIGICSVCGHESIVERYFPKGHDYECVTIIQHCTKEGKKVFTCSRCGDSYEELIPPRGHGNIEWLYYTQTNELMACCEWCGDILVQQEKAKITGASLALGESLSMKYYATMPDLLFETAEVWMRFTYDGQEFWADGVKDSKSGEYVFALNRIPPSKKDSIIKAELCVVSGIVVVGDDGSDWSDCAVIAAKESYSIGMYYQDVKAYYPDNESLNRLVSTLEVYNKAAENYENGVSADPSDVDWTPVIDTDYNLSEPAAETTYFTAAGVRFGYINRLFFKFTAEDLNGLTVKVNDTLYTAADFALVEGTENTYIIYSKGIYATEFDKIFEIVLAINGEEVQTLEYSVKSYVKAKQDDPEMGALVRALYNYGKSSELYRDEI